MARTGTIAIAAAILAVVGVGGTYLWSELRQTGDFAQCTRGAVAGGALGGPFNLVSENRGDGDRRRCHRPADPALLRLYLFLPDALSASTAMRQRGRRWRMPENRGGGCEDGFFIQRDPAGTYVEVVRDFTDNSPTTRCWGLRGRRRQGDAAAKAYRVYYDARTERTGSSNSWIIRPSTYLVLPEAGFHRRLPP